MGRAWVPVRPPRGCAVRRAGALLLYGALAAAGGCTTSPVPRPQVLVRVDTDAPVPSFVDRVRIEVFDAAGAPQETPREFPLLNPSDWPLTFGLRAEEGGPRVRARLRIRAFRSGYEQLDEPSAQPSIPAGVTIDRLVDVDFTATAGVPIGYVAVVLQADCLGVPADPAAGTTCIAAVGADPLGSGGKSGDFGVSLPVQPERISDLQNGSPSLAGTWAGAREVPCSLPLRAPVDPDEERIVRPRQRVLFRVP